MRTNGLIDTVAGAGPGADGVGGVATRALVEAPVGVNDHRDPRESGRSTKSFTFTSRS